MAIPSAVGGWGGGNYRPTGILVAAYPSTVRGVPIEIQNSTSTGAASSNWGSIFLPPSTRGPLFHTYNLPLSTKRYYFKARHNGGGFGAGSFTPIVSARPVALPDFMPPITLNAAGNIEAPGANIIISSGNAPVVGSQNSTSFVTKTLRFPASALLRESTTYSEGRGIGTFVIALNSSGKYQWQFVMPQGVTISRVRYCGTLRPTTTQISELKFYRVSTAGSASLVATLTMTTGAVLGRAVISSSALSETVTNATDFIGEVSLKTSTAGYPSVIYGEVEYQMASYVKAY